MCILCLSQNPFAVHAESESERAKNRAKRIKIELDYLKGWISNLDASDPTREHYEELQTKLKQEQYDIGQKL